MSRQETKLWGIFDCKISLFQNQFFAFKGRYDKSIESIGTITDELGKSFIKVWYKKNNESILMAKDYAIKYNQDASNDILLFAYQNDKNNLYYGQYSWLIRHYFPSISSIDKILPLQKHKPFYIPGGLSVLSLGQNQNSLIDCQPQIQTFYEINNKNPPTKKEIETCFKRIKHLSY